VDELWPSRVGRPTVHRQHLRVHRRSTGPVGAPTLPDLRKDGFSTESTAPTTTT